MNGQASTGYTCAVCGQPYGDPLYHGPIGHAPQTVCLDCWYEHWDLVECRMRNGGQWRHLDAALYLVARGFSQPEVARMLGLCRKSLYNLLQRLRADPEKIPEWFLAPAW